jgi:hypothetical protein
LYPCSTSIINVAKHTTISQKRVDSKHTTISQKRRDDLHLFVLPAFVYNTKTNEQLTTLKYDLVVYQVTTMVYCCVFAIYLCHQQILQRCFQFSKVFNQIPPNPSSTSTLKQALPSPLLFQ